MSDADPDDPLADLLDDLLPEETKPETKSSIQRAKPGKSAASPAASPILKTETCELNINIRLLYAIPSLITLSALL